MAVVGDPGIVVVGNERGAFRTALEDRHPVVFAQHVDPLRQVEVAILPLEEHHQHERGAGHPRQRLARLASQATGNQAGQQGQPGEGCQERSRLERRMTDHHVGQVAGGVGHARHEQQVARFSGDLLLRAHQRGQQRAEQDHWPQRKRTAKQQLVHQQQRLGAGVPRGKALLESQDRQVQRVDGADHERHQEQPGLEAHAHARRDPGADEDPQHRHRQRHREVLPVRAEDEVGQLEEEHLERGAGQTGECQRQHDAS